MQTVMTHRHSAVYVSDCGRTDRSGLKYCNFWLHVQVWLTQQATGPHLSLRILVAMGTATSAAFFLSSALTPISCLPIIMSNLPCIQGKDPDSTACAAKAAAGDTTTWPTHACQHTGPASVEQQNDAFVNYMFPCRPVIPRPALVVPVASYADPLWLLGVGWLIVCSC
jgi:hypothetical protein